ncbi:MFS family permease [Kibdelosporangium banguiense]|uniref:MFS family permease n=1 Tax=Kibdelosporangium banguiense TaxID=1365924 RepID=A0ABS4TNV2_9PSEU|nr:MFS transporter [Kibdelosporangium banguiense]MBP2326083.1 MFS family permease [Kibdelosporangium banguiense]
MNRIQPRGHPAGTLVTVSLGGMIVGLDGTALTIAGPDIARAAGASLTELQWIANAYLVALAIALFPAGRLADRAGRRATFIAGVAGFGVASLLIAASSTAWLLIVLRAVQGICGALLQPAALALVRATFSGKRLDLALGIWGGAGALSIAAGPVVAGLIVQNFGWPVVFLINVPIAAITVVLALCTVSESRARDSLDRPRDLLRFPGVALGAVLTGLSYFSLYGLLFFLTLYLQNVRGLDPVGAAGWLLPLTAVVVVSAPIGGALTARFGPRWPTVGGLVLIFAGMLGFLALDQASTQAEMLPAALIVGAGTGFALIAATQVIVANAPESMSGLASALQQVATQLGGVAGILVLGLVMAWRVGDLAEPGTDVDQAAQGLGPGSAVFMSGFHAAVVTAAIVIAVGAVLAMRTSDRTSPQPARPPDVTSDVDGQRRHQQ